jgi:excisionase family DNA binding protein
MTDVDLNADETIDDEAAAALLHCEPMTVRELALQGAIPGIKFGRGWIFVREQLLQHVADLAQAEAERRRGKGITSSAAPLVISVQPSRRTKGRRRKLPSLDVTSA